MIGAKLGQYEVLSALGAGGMGEVYKARDTKLDRLVALKVLPAALATNAGLLARFEREAKAVAALSHPNVLGIYDLGRDGETTYAVMELLEGETLRERLAGGPLPPKRAIELALQMAHGLAAAHEKGIIHRDLKPENVFRTKDGRVKILDFGLAKQLPTPSSGGETSVPTVAISSDVKTQAGILLGTVGYMSPEQVRGEPADARSDIFSFGCCFLEMLTGQRAFRGVTAIDTLHAILNAEPDLHHESITPGLQSLLEHCLHKDPGQRFHSALDIAFALESSTGSSRPLPVLGRKRSRASLARPLGFAGAAAAGALLAALAIGRFAAPPAAGLDAYRFTPVVAEGGAADEAAWSRSGRTIAYVKTVDRVAQLHVRDLDADNPRQLTRVAQACGAPFFSPDDSRVYYLSGRSVFSVAKVGGDPERVQENADAADLSPDGTTLAIWRATSRDGKTSSTLWLASPPTAEAKKYEPAPFSMDAAYVPVHLRFSPDGRRLFLSTYTVEGWSAWLIPFPGGAGAKPARVFTKGELSSPPLLSFLPDGRHAVLSTQESAGVQGRLFLADLDRGAVRPILVGAVSSAGAAVSPDGTKLLYTSGGTDYDLVEIPLDGSGVRSLLATSRDEHSAAFLPATSQLLFVASRGGQREIRIRGLTDGFERTVAAAKDFPPGEYDLQSPAVSPDGSSVAFTRLSSGSDAGFAIWVSPTAGGAPSRLVSRSEGTEIAPTWSPDGKWIAFIRTRQGKRALMKARVGASEPPVVLTDAPDKMRIGPLEWSPTGEWISSAVRDAIVLVSPDGQASRTLPKAAGVWGAHAWSRDGARIYTIQEGAQGHHRIVAIDVATGGTEVLSEVSLDESSTLQTPANYGLRLTLSPDGKSLSATLARTRTDIWMLEGFPSR